MVSAGPNFLGLDDVLRGNAASRQVKPNLNQTEIDKAARSNTPAVIHRLRLAERGQAPSRNPNLGALGDNDPRENSPNVIQRMRQEEKIRAGVTLDV